MLLCLLLLSLNLLTCVKAIHLFVASYSNGSGAGNVSTLFFNQTLGCLYDLKVASSVNTSTKSPSWLTFDRKAKILYMIDEAIDSPTNGTIVAYRAEPKGQLTEISRTEALVGGVSSTFYADGGALAVAHYTGSTLQTYAVSGSGNLKALQTFNFLTPDFQVGPFPTRQESPHPHQALLDPTGQFILVPDLGADLVHIFKVDPRSKSLTPQPSLRTTPGYGPRHAVFTSKKLGSGCYTFYLVGELSGKVTTYKVDYPENGSKISFENVTADNTLNPEQVLPNNPDGTTKVAPAEIDITPDGSMLLVSNRNDTTFGTSPPIDSLVSYLISSFDGGLSKMPLVSATGSYPRHFALNKAGNLMAVGLQNSGSVVILHKSGGSGLFDQQIAKVNLPYGANIPVCIVWDE